MNTVFVNDRQLSKSFKVRQIPLFKVICHVISHEAYATATGLKIEGKKRTDEIVHEEHMTFI